MSLSGTSHPHSIHSNYLDCLTKWLTDHRQESGPELRAARDRHRNDKPSHQSGLAIYGQTYKSKDLETEILRTTHLCLIHGVLDENIMRTNCVSTNPNPNPNPNPNEVDHFAF